jgi:hypothetical protein
MFEFYIMTEFDTYLLIDLLDDSRPWEFVFGAGVEHLEQLQVHFHVETCSYIQVLVICRGWLEINCPFL